MLADTMRKLMNKSWKHIKLHCKDSRGSLTADSGTDAEPWNRSSSQNNVSRPQPMSNQMKDKIFNAMLFVLPCGKCVFNSNHDACVSKFLNDVNARTKKPNVVPISTRKPKRQANKSVATPHKKTVASESTTTSSKSYYRMLYHKTSKAWKWWIAQQCPSIIYMVPKTQKKWFPKNSKEMGSNLSCVHPSSTSLAYCTTHPIHVDSGCTKHMTGNVSLLCNFVDKYLGTVRFGNDQFAPILGYGDLIQGNITIKRGNDLLTGNRGTDLYTISLQETTSSTSICFMAKASPTQAWLWHRRLSHLNFDYINLLSKKDVVIGLPKLNSKGRLNLLHIDLCGPMRVASINGKKYIMVIVDDYSRYTWTFFLPSKDETPEVLKYFLMMIQRNLQALVISVRTDKGTEFLNKTLNAFFKEEGIELQTSTPRTPKQNGIVERQNRTLVEAARTMLSASKLPLFFWAEAITTACYTQNRSIIIPTHEKMAYHIINDKKPSIKYLHIFGCTCYLTRDGENLDKMKEKGDSCILVGYSTQSKGYRVYNKRTRLIVESIHLRFDEIKKMSETSVANDTSGLVPQRQNIQHSNTAQELDLLFGPLYDEFFNAGTLRVNKSSSPTDDSAKQDTLPSTNIHPTTKPSTPTHVNAEENNNDQAKFTNLFCTPVQENAESSSRNIADNMLVEVGKFTFPIDFVILDMEKDSKVPLILGRPFLHTADAVIRVKQKQLNLGVGTERMIFPIDFAMKHSYSNDNTCFSIDLIDYILEEDFDALLDEVSKILHSIKGTILEEKLFAEFDEFMAMKILNPNPTPKNHHSKKSLLTPITRSKHLLP
ncbi:retrovirus-related pol polyprotein from transposon TNT 1-94 [Tanacetum coccineum]